MLKFEKIFITVPSPLVSFGLNIQDAIITTEKYLSLVKFKLLLIFFTYPL